MSIINNHGQNGVRPGRNINISVKAAACATACRERGYAVKNPCSILVAVCDYCSARISAAYFASLVVGTYKVWPVVWAWAVI